MDKEDTYNIKNCLCGNCDFGGDIEIKKGVKLEEAICPNCGNKGGHYKKPETTSYYDFE